MCATYTSQIPHLTPAPSPPPTRRGDILLLSLGREKVGMREGVIILYEIQIIQ